MSGMAAQYLVEQLEGKRLEDEMRVYELTTYVNLRIH